MMRLGVLSLVSGSGAFLLNGQHIAHERVDPIVQPGIVGGHLHDVVGASSFGVAFTDEAWRNANCSSMAIQENKSNYWMPSLMARHDNGTYSAIPLSEARIYYLNNHREGTKLTAFPQGFRILAGNPSATADTPNEPGRVGGRIGYRCQNGYNDGREYHTPHLPKFECLDFLRMEIAFQDCWDGKNLDSLDHKSHVAYRLSNGDCPPSHPVPMMEIDLELGYKTQGYRWDQLLLSTGDQVGYGLHADYLSFWDVELLQRALDDPTCQHRENIAGDSAQCETLKPFRNDAAMHNCRLEGAIPQEDTGIPYPIPNLPGCNQPWNSSKGEIKPSCPVPPPTPALGPASDFVNFSWQRFLLGTRPVWMAIYNGFNPAPAPPVSSMTKTTTSRPATTLSTVTAAVTSKSSTSTSTTSKLSSTTSKTTSLSPAPTSAPNWSSLGCYTDSTTARGLPVRVDIAGGMTIEGCTDACAKKGYVLAGVEYSSECWCGNSIGASAVKAAESDCNMKCSGKQSQICGGPNRLNIYSKNGYSPSTSSSYLFICPQTNWGGACQNTLVRHSTSCLSFKGTSYYKNIRSAGPDTGRCIFYAGDNCDDGSATFGPLQYPGVTTFGTQNGIWGSVRCFP